VRVFRYLHPSVQSRPDPIKRRSSSLTVRNKSAAFYQFSSDVDERTRQIAELKAAHLETEAARQSVEIPLPFTSSTNRPPPPPPKVFGGKASEKRKRELDERRALLEARKRKKEASEVEDLFSAISKDLSSDLI
jgi:DNA-binding transcriptional MerR regulator